MLPFDPEHPLSDLVGLTRREFFGRTAQGFGALALASLLPSFAFGETKQQLGLHHPAKAKRIIYLFQAGGPAQQDLFDYKPMLNEQNGQQLPDHIRGGQRLTGMSAQQASIPLAGSLFKFARHGQSGAWLSETLPHHRRIVDEI